MNRNKAQFAGRRAAFTLIELMVAIGLTTIFLYMVAVVFTQAQGSFSRAKATIHMAQEANVIFDFMEKDLETATLVTYFDAANSRQEGYFRAEGSPTAANDPPGPAPPDSGSAHYTSLPTLYFVTNGVQADEASSFKGATEPLLVSYRLEWTRKMKNRLASDGSEPAEPRRGVFRLVRRVLKAHDDAYETTGTHNYTVRDLHTADQSDLPVNDSDNDPVSDPVGFNVLWVGYRFFDPDTRLWSETGEWGTADVDPTVLPQTPDKLPSVVEVTLTLADPELREEATYTARFTVNAAAN